jgi:hypothetical protein
MVLIGASADASLLNLQAAINLSGTFGTTHTSVFANTDVTAGGLVAHALSFASRITGTAGNSVTTTTASAGTAHLSWGGGTLSGGTVVKASAGWTKEYSGFTAPCSGFALGGTSATSGTFVNPNLPTTAKVGDLWIATAQMYDSISAVTTINTPAGWTLLGSVMTYGSRANGDKVGVYYKYVTPADIGGTGTVTFQNSGINNSAWLVHISAHRGVQIDAGASIVMTNQAQGITTSPAAPAISPPAAGYTLVSYVFDQTSSAPTVEAPPTGFGRFVSTSNVGSGQWFSAAMKGLTIGSGPTSYISNPSGTQGPFTWSNITTSTGHMMVMIALKPQQVAPTVAVYRPASGARHYLHIDDSGYSFQSTVGTAFAGVNALETMSDANNGTLPFTNGGAVGFTKSNTADGTARPWAVAADSRTMYLFGMSGVTAGAYDQQLVFGEFYSYISGEATKQILTAGTFGTTTGQFALTASTTGSAAVGTGQLLPRNFAGSYAPQVPYLVRDSGHFWNSAVSANAKTGLSSVWAFPNTADGGVYACRTEIWESLTSPTARAPRGRLRGFASPMHPTGSLIDGEVYAGAGDYSGRTFQVIANVYQPNADISTSGMVLIETPASGDWDVST